MDKTGEGNRRDEAAEHRAEFPTGGTGKAATVALPADFESRKLKLKKSGGNSDRKNDRYTKRRLFSAALSASAAICHRPAAIGGFSFARSQAPVRPFAHPIAL
ncbi:hypothetical protein [Gorillibacterium sp. sgz500922]|uniref:hypothetical protein n=1 Tax=Gorillibacterium sp. sgz500922 TaxID=3446694 RepID=UPI003F66B7F5